MTTPSLVTVGAAAPHFPLTELTAVTQGRPRVIAFVRGWSLGDEDTQQLDGLRARVLELDSELVVLSPGGVWSLRPEDETARYSEQLVGEVATAAMLFGVQTTGDAVFVLDGRGFIRFAFRSNQPVTATVAAAFDSAAEALAARERHGKLARVLFTRREWAMAALVVGCSLTFMGEMYIKRTDARAEVIDTTFDRIDHRRRLARGSGPVPTRLAALSDSPRPRIPLPPLPRPAMITRKP